MSTGTHRLVGEILVPLDPADAFPLFTPLGERRWVDGWHPRFPGGSDDDTAPGTVFETDAHGRRTTWIVTASDRPRRIAYALVARDDRAGTVSLALDARDAGTRVEVEYVLTALAPAADSELGRFADEYVDYLQSWERAIVEHLRGGSTHTAG